jgi:hypothetical protein
MVRILLSVLLKTVKRQESTKLFAAKVLPKPLAVTISEIYRQIES